MTPDTIGRFEIKCLLGKGGMGSVYKAWDPKLHRLVALKIINLDQIESPKARDEFKRRFFKEARICGGLNHRGVLTIHDIGEEVGTPFIATEYIEGSTLSRFLDETEHLDGKTLGSIFLQIGEALDYAHESGIIHRDIKPQNIMIDGKGKITILDFGLAKLTESEMTHLTRPGDFVGSPSYSSPEQVKGENVDHRTDIFSFGVTAYELITGYRPFMGGNINAVLFKIISGEPDPIMLPHSFPDKILPVLTDIFNQALHKLPDRRFQSAGELAKVLNAVLSDGDLSWTVHAEIPTRTASMNQQETMLLGGSQAPEATDKTAQATRWYQASNKKSARTPPLMEAGVSTPDQVPVSSINIKGLILAGVLLVLFVSTTIWWQVGRKKNSPDLVESSASMPTQTEPQVPDGEPGNTAEPEEKPVGDPEEKGIPEERQPEKSPPVRDNSTPGEDSSRKRPVQLALLSFPDPAFEKWLVSQYDQDGNGALDKEEAKKVTSLNTPGQVGQGSGIRDLTGIGYFSELKSLICANEDLTQLPPLPSNLRYLDCTGNHLTALSGLPVGLTTLKAGKNRIQILDRLPAGLQEMDLSNNQLENLPQLPRSLKDASLAGNRFGKIPTLPSDLNSLDLSNNLFDAGDCPDLNAVKIARFRYSPLADGREIDCLKVEAQRNQNKARRDKVTDQFQSAIKASNLEASRSALIELEQLDGVENQHLFALQKLETAFLMENWRPNMPVAAETIARFQKTAALGSADAQYAVGFLFEKGIGDRANHFEAKKWYEKAAEQNYLPAIYGLGLIYEAGEAVPRDNERAATFYLKAAEAGYAPAEHKVGEIYRTGNGMDRSYELAVTWFLKAAEKDYAPAQASLGYMYEEGLGVTGSKKENKKRAAYWYCRAAAQGNGTAKMGLKKLKQKESDCTLILKEEVR